MRDFALDLRDSLAREAEKDARIAELEQERDTTATDLFDRARDAETRADAAEARVAELEAALQRVSAETKERLVETLGFYGAFDADKIVARALPDLPARAAEATNE